MRIVLSLLIIQCTLFASNEAFAIGSERTYSLINDVNIYDLKSPDHPFGYRIVGSLKVANVWGSDQDSLLLKFELTNPKLFIQKYKSQPQHFDEKRSILDTQGSAIFYAEWKQGKILRVFLPAEETDESIKNLRKSIVSLFQYQLLDGQLVEDDISGNCDVTYTAKSSTKYEKRKTLCRSTDMEYHERSDKPLGVVVKSARTTDYSVTPDGTVETVHSSEYHKFQVNAYSKVATVVESVFALKFDGRISNTGPLKAQSFDEAVKLLKNYKENSLSPTLLQSSDEISDIVDQIKARKALMKDEFVGKQESALTLLKLLPAGRLAETEDFQRILKARSTQDIKLQLVDLLGAIQTTESHEAFKLSFDVTKEEDFSYVERYLQSLAVGTRPKEAVIDDLHITVEKIENEKLKDTFIQTLASMALRYAQLPGKSYMSKIVEKVTNFILKSLEECKEEACQMVFLRGIQNLRAPSAIKDVLKYAVEHPYAVSVAAMKAIRVFPVDRWSKQIKKQFENIFYQQFKKYDSSARTLALDILLEMKPNLESLERMLQFLKSNDKAYEVKQYLLQKLKMLADKCPAFKANLKKLLVLDPHLNNWNIFGGLKGLSTALARSFSKTPSFNSTLLSVQEMSSGVLKRGIVDLTVESDEKTSSLFTLGIFAGGLSSFMSSSDEVDPDEDATATAGMELAIQGSQMRPLIFFRGQGELMGHVWSGTASEATPAYRGITLLQDHNQVLRLHNGALMDLSAIGALSVDLNGKIEISLWSRNANSKVEQNIGTALISRLIVKSSIVNMGIELTLSEEPQLNLESKIDFSGDTALCMQLSQPNTLLKQQSLKFVKIPSTKYGVKQVSHFKYNISGYTHSLNRKNNEMCSKILS